MYGKKVEGTIRSTFVIGPEGKLAKVFPSVKVDGHVEQVLAALGVTMGDPQRVPQTPPVASQGASAPTAKKAPAKKAPAKPPAKKAPAKKG
jgi:peroxiredoxin Q/BCP